MQRVLTNYTVRTLFLYKKNSQRELLHRLIGKTGFEPATPWSQTKCSTKLSYFPFTKKIKMQPVGVEPTTA